MFEEIYGQFGIHSVICGIIAPEASGWFREPIESVEDFDKSLSLLEPGDIVSVHAVAPVPGDGSLQHRIINMTVPERD